MSHELKSQCEYSPVGDGGISSRYEAVVRLSRLPFPGYYHSQEEWEKMICKEMEEGK